MTGPPIAVVVPTFDRRALLAALVEAVLPDPATGEVVVVDDGSADGTRDWVARRARDEPRLRLVQLGGRGPAHARQAGIEAAGAPAVLLLDDDVTPRPGLVSGHAARLAADEDVVVAGYTPSVLAPARRPGDTAEIAYARDYERHCERWEAGEPVLDALWAGNLSLWRTRALEIGFASDRYEERFAVHEDRDFGLRCAAAGMRGVFDRALRADHHYRRSTRRAAVDATRRSAGTIRLHAAHPALGTFDPAQYEQGVPAAARPVLRALRRDPVGGRLLEGQIRVVDGLSRVGAAGSADLAFRITRRFAEQVGMARRDGGVAA